MYCAVASTLSRVGGCKLLLSKREREREREREKGRGIVKGKSERDGIVREGRRLGSSVLLLLMMMMMVLWVLFLWDSLGEW